MSLALDQPAASDSGTASAAVAAVRRLLDAVRREARTWIWVESLAWLAVAAAVAFWASLAFDWAIEPPGWVRGVVAGLAFGGLAWIAVTKLVVRLTVPLSDASLAIAVERGHPGFRDSLSTTIALAGLDRPDVDGRLLARTAAEAAALLDAVEPARIFRRRTLVSLAVLAAAAAGSIGLLGALRPDLGRTWTRRMLWLSPEPWPRSVGLEAEGFRNGVRTVARGADVDLVVHARGAAGPPAAVDVRLRGEAGWTTARMGTRGGVQDGVQTFVHVLKGVGADIPLEIRGGDARLRNLRLHVADPPGIESLTIRCLLPDYLGGGARTLSAARTVAIPCGSRVAIDCTATKTLRVARLARRPAGAGDTAGGADLPAAAAETTVAGIDPAPPGTRSISGTLDAVLTDTAVVVQFVDTDGLVSRVGTAFTLVAVPDEPPRVGLRLAGGPTAVTPRGRLVVEGTVSDDHGLAAAAVTLRAMAAGPRGGPAAGGGENVGMEGPEVAVPIDRVHGGETVLDIGAADPLLVPLDPLRLALGGRLRVSATARDGCTLAGGPNVGTGDTWTLDVVTPEELRARLEAREILLRRRFETVIEDLARARGRLTPAEGGEDADAVPRCGEAATRAAGETADIGAGFRGIGLELANNGLLSPELQSRLVAGIGDPLALLSGTDLPALAAACRRVAAGPAVDAAAIARRTDALLDRMRAVLARMLEAESINEIIERMRSVLRAQEAIRAETLEVQKRQAREALERP